MKHSALKRWIFVALLLALIVGTILGHAHAAPPEHICAGQIHGASLEDSPAAVQQKINEIMKRTELAGGGVRANAGWPTNLPFYGFFPFVVPVRTWL